MPHLITNPRRQAMALEMIDPLIREFERRNLFRHAESARRVKARVLRQQIANAAHNYQRWHLRTNPRPAALIGFPTASAICNWPLAIPQSQKAA